MGTIARSNRHRPRRAVAVIGTTIAAIALSSFGPTSAQGTVQHTASDVSAVPGVVNKANAPFLFQYTFNGHLKLGGGNYTLNGRVFVVVKFNNGTVRFRTWVTAWDHPYHPGGAVYVDTGIPAPCAGSSNGYARAYDQATARWSPRVPVTICVRFD
ncbi:hypothetical protein [Streptomyces sp. NPDC046161]|uniref:hypothetical protein n=1 Tax=Streptomyces sp. NPDC046161 TaxID=3155132 RepID=UPI0033E48F9B